MSETGGRKAVFDIATGEVVREITAHADGVSDEITALAYVSGSHLLAVRAGYGDSKITLWNPETGELARELTHHQAHIPDLAVSPDGPWLASASADQSVRLWDSRTWDCVAMIPKVIEWGADERPLARGEFPEANALDLSPDGRLLVWGDMLGSIHWWDLEAGQPLGSQWAHRDVVVGVAFSRDFSRVGTVGNDASVALWDASSRVPIKPVFKGHMHGAHSVAFSPDGRRLVTTGGAPSEAIRLWDPSTSRELATLTGKGQIFNRVSFSSDGDWLAACSLTGQLNLWHAPSWEAIAEAETKEKAEGRQP